MPAERSEMLGSAVTFMLGETVLRVQPVILFHTVISFYFRENGSGGDGSRAQVAVDESFLLDREIEFDGVEQKVIRERVQLRDGGDHCLAAGLVDVPGINSAGVDFGDGPGQGVPANAFGENETPLGIYFFGIVEADDAAGGTEDNGSGNDRAEERTTASFVETSDAQPTVLSRFAFVTPRAEPFHVRGF